MARDLGIEQMLTVEGATDDTVHELKNEVEPDLSDSGGDIGADEDEDGFAQEAAWHDEVQAVDEAVQEEDEKQAEAAAEQAEEDERAAAAEHEAEERARREAEG